MIKLLEQYLGSINESIYNKKRPRAEGTELITSVIQTFAKENQFGFEREVFLGLTRKTNDYKGLIDIIIIKPDGTRYAIEIDSSNKKWSLEKLIHAHNIGYVPVWIRWHTKIKIEIPKHINLINLIKGK
ncbi:MAG: hypothetical protein A2Y10_14050 [Planctomycetes bacterium GWF2_41_51]|nr:MAG: hypothetical protein A2Y10_14050 [Planctomycetes bacterium GWF2_41_51]